MSSFETFADGGIIVARQMFDPALVDAFATEANELLERGRGNYYFTTGEKSPSLVQSKALDYANFSGHVAVTKVVAGIMGPLAPTSRLVINRQAPHAFQRFHPDFHVKAIAMLHGNGGGAFDFVEHDVNPNPYERDDDQMGIITEYAPNDFINITLDAGDVVFQLDTGIIHRGRNLSDKPRITGAMYTSL